MEPQTEPKEKRDPGNFDALLERAPELEAWHGIVLDHLAAQYDRSTRNLSVFCEIRPIEGRKLKHDIELTVAAYDTNDRIVAHDTNLLFQEKFYGFDVVHFVFFDLNPKKMSALRKIKVFPSKWR